jgi:beta-phosphoglucomutase-like phosphatase (HAD superfamily)
MLVLEDSQLGCQAAVAAGAVTVAVPGAHNTLAQYPEVNLCVSCLSDPRVLARLQRPVED